MILPVLNSESMNQIIFPKTGYVVPEGASSPETPDCIIKSIIQNYLASKRNNTVVSLSIMGIKGNGRLTDELDYEWVEGTRRYRKGHPGQSSPQGHQGEERSQNIRFEPTTDSKLGGSQGDLISLSSAVRVSGILADLR